MSEKRYRLIRVLEYEGTMKFIQSSLVNRSVKGSIKVQIPNAPPNCIRETIVGPVEGFVELDPETLEEVPNE